MSTAPSMKDFRAAVIALCPEVGKGYVTAPQLTESFGLSGQSQTNITRRRLQEMMERGELEKIGRGMYRRTGKEPLRRGDGYARMWQAVRSAKHTFTAREIVSLTRLESSGVGKYINVLIDAGYVAVVGKQGTSRVYRLTQAGKDRFGTPYPPKEIEIPFLTERTAAGRICTIMLREDISLPRVREKICEQLRILNIAFNQNENTGDPV